MSKYTSNHHKNEWIQITYQIKRKHKSYVSNKKCLNEPNKISDLFKVLLFSKITDPPHTQGKLV